MPQNLDPVATQCKLKVDAWQNVARMCYMQAVASPKTRPRKPPVRQDPIQVNIRISPEHLERLDAWLEEINAARGWPKLTRTDVIRNLLARGLEERPEWMGK